MRDFRRLYEGIPETFKDIIKNFILGEAIQGRDRPLGLVEFGRMLWKTPKMNENGARAVSQTAIIMVCRFLAMRHREYVVRLNEHRRDVFRAMGAPDIADQIRAGNAEKAVAMLCARLQIKPWIIRGCVERAIRQMSQEHQPTNRHAAGAAA